MRGPAPDPADPSGDPPEVTPTAAAGETFDAYYDREYRRLLALATAMCASTGAAEDVVQEAFVAALGRWGRIEDPDAWMRRVIANRSVSLFRRRSVETHHRRLRRPAEVAPDPAERVEALDLWPLVRTLPRRQIQVVALRFVDGASIDEIAGALGLSPNTVKTHLRRALAALADRHPEEP